MRRRLQTEAIAAHAAMLHRQSTTLQAARTEYQRRYKLTPPPGFDQWYGYAVEHSSPVIDEFDDLMADLKVFRSWFEGGCDLGSGSAASRNTHHLCIKDGKVVATSQVKDNMLQSLEDMVHDFIGQIPDLCLELNQLNTPRLISGSSSGIGDAMAKCAVPNFKDLSKKMTWRTIVKSCAKNSPARTGKSNKRIPSSSHGLIKDWEEATDLCSWTEAPPSGLVRGPEYMLLGESKTPILSASRLSTFADILYPSLARYSNDTDVSDLFTFEVKRKQVGWRGSSSGGWADGDNWAYFQRHRMVSLAQGAIAGANKAKTAPLKDLIAPTAQLRKWLDIGFTRLISCGADTCRKLRAEFRIVPELTRQQIMANKIVLDMDGDGLSGRFYQLLRSNSAVLKQGLIREWHETDPLASLYTTEHEYGGDA